MCFCWEHLLTNFNVFFKTKVVSVVAIATNNNIINKHLARSKDLLLIHCENHLQVTLRFLFDAPF